MFRTIFVSLAICLSTYADSVDPVFLKTGKQQFLICAACHGQNGEGTAAAPPLAGSEWVNGPEENLIRIQLRGLQGPIRVRGQEYNITGGMAALAYQTDEQIAAVLSYVRSSFGNSSPPVAAAAVSKLRSEVGKPQTNSEELITTNPLPIRPSPSHDISNKYDKLPNDSSSNQWIAIVAGIFVIGIIAQALRLRGK